MVVFPLVVVISSVASVADTRFAEHAVEYHVPCSVKALRHPPSAA
jgi:hypothetical protein